jgi:O-antigen/teichoic acid export membrane protein
MRVLGAFFVNVVFNFVIGLLVAKFLGPEEYGRFALALATAVAVQVAFVDWLRLGATRFYSERTRDEEPAIRATLDLGFAAVTAGLAAGSVCLFMTGIRFSLSNGLIALALGAAVANGLFDFSTALVRARFHDQLYTKLIVVKNILSLGLTGGGAFYFGSAKMALIGGIISLSGSVIAVRAALRDPFTLARMASFKVAKSILRYAMPIVAANLLYLCIPLANRSLLSIYYGFSETGQFSLAFDIGTKALAAIGTALDVLLFQIAVATHDKFGLEQSRQRIADNLGIVIAVMVPACTGIWLVLPSIEQVIVPQEYHGPFGDLLNLMLPGLFCSAMILFGLNPMFQIVKRTWPLIGAALAGCIADPLILLALPRGLGANSLAIAQSGAFAVSLVTLTLVACLWNPRWPRWRDLVGTTLGTAAMAAALLPLRAQPAGIITLLEQVAAGTIVYSAIVFAFDIAKLRTIIFGRVLPIVRRFNPG